MLLRSCLYERRDETKMRDGMIKGRRKTPLFLYRTVIERVTVNETGAFSIRPDKGERCQYFVYTLPLYKQPVL